jgi:hypothetical protein
MKASKYFLAKMNLDTMNLVTQFADRSEFIAPLDDGTGFTMLTNQLQPNSAMSHISAK